MSEAYDGEVVFKTKIDESGVKQGISNLKKGLADGFSNMRDVMQGPVAAIKDLSEALKGIGDFTLGSSAKIETLTASFTTLLQSADKGKKMMADIIQFANVTPFEALGLSKAAKTLMGFGTVAEDVLPTLKMLGDVSGGNQEKLDSLALAFGQVESAGKLMGQEVLQFINAGFNPLQAISEKTGESMLNLRKRMEAGNVTFKEVQQAFKDITSEGGRFYNGMALGATTAEGKQSTMNDALHAAGRAIGDILLPHLKNTYDSVTNTANAFTNWATENDNLKNTLKALLDTMALVAISLGTFFIVGNISAAFVILKNVIFEVRFAMLLLNEAIMKNPWGLVISGLVAAGFALKNYADDQNKVQESLDRSTESAKKFQKQLDSMKIQGLSSNEISVIDNKIESASKSSGILKGGKVIPFDNASGNDVLAWYNNVAKSTKLTAEQFSQLVLTSDKASEKLKNIAKAYLGVTDASGLVTSQYEIQDSLVKKGLITEEDAIKEKIKLREAEINKLEENYKKNSGFLAGEEEQWKAHLAFIKQYNARLAVLNNKNSPEMNPLSMPGPITADESRQIAENVKNTAGSFSMLLSPVEQFELGIHASGEGIKEVSYTISDKLVAGLSVASHLLQKMGTDDAAQLAVALNSVASIISNMGKAAAGDPAAIASVAIAGIDLLGQAWDALWGNQSKAQKKAAEEAAKAEADRIAAVKQIDEEYKRKSQNEMQNMEDERDKAIAEARRVGANVFQIEAYYAGKIAELKIKYSGTETEEIDIKAQEEAIKKRYDRLKQAVIDSKEAIVGAEKNTVSGWHPGEMTIDQEIALLEKLQGSMNEKPEQLAWLKDYKSKRIASLAAGELSSLDEAMRNELANIEVSFASYKANYENAFTGLGSAISNGLKNGLDEAEISDTINTMIKNLAIDAAIAASSFQTSFADIGKMIADALSDGIIDSSELSAINIQKNLLTAKAMSIGDAINQVFGSGSYSSSQALNLNLDTIVTVDGQTLATATLRYTDSVLGRTYGS